MPGGYYDHVFLPRKGTDYDVHINCNLLPICMQRPDHGPESYQCTSSCSCTQMTGHDMRNSFARSTARACQPLYCFVCRLTHCKTYQQNHYKGYSIGIAYLKTRSVSSLSKIRTPLDHLRSCSRCHTSVRNKDTIELRMSISE